MGVRMVGGKLVNDDEGSPIAEPVDEIPTPDASAEADGYPRCAECNEINYEWQPGTRGRKPKYHEGCRPVTPNRSAASGSRVTFRNENALREALHSRYHMLSSIFTMIHPAYGAGVRDRIEQAVEADIRYAKVNASFRKHLESMCEKTAAGEVIAVHVAMFAPVVVGEAAKRGRTKAARQTPEAARGRPQPEAGTNPRHETPDPSTAPNTGGPRPDNVTRIRANASADMPGEPEGPAETVNAGAMPGMPG